MVPHIEMICSSNKGQIHIETYQKPPEKHNFVFQSAGSLKRKIYLQLLFLCYTFNYLGTLCNHSEFPDKVKSSNTVLRGGRAGRCLTGCATGHIYV